MFLHGTRISLKTSFARKFPYSSSAFLSACNRFPPLRSGLINTAIIILSNVALRKADQARESLKRRTEQERPSTHPSRENSKRSSPKPLCLLSPGAWGREGTRKAELGSVVVLRHRGEGPRHPGKEARSAPGPLPPPPLPAGARAAAAAGREPPCHTAPCWPPPPPLGARRHRPARLPRRRGRGSARRPPRRTHTETRSRPSLPSSGGESAGRGQFLCRRGNVSARCHATGARHIVWASSFQLARVESRLKEPQLGSCSEKAVTKQR